MQLSLSSRATGRDRVTHKQRQIMGRGVLPCPSTFFLSRSLGRGEPLGEREAIVFRGQKVMGAHRSMRPYKRTGT